MTNLRGHSPATEWLGRSRPPAIGLASLLLVGAAMAPGPAVALPPAAAPAAFVHLVRTIDDAASGVARPAGLAYSADADRLLVLDASAANAGSVPLVPLSRLEAQAAIIQVAVRTPDPVNIAYDAGADQFLVLQPDGTVASVATVAGKPQGGAAAVEIAPGPPIDIGDPAGMAADGGTLFVLDAAEGRIVARDRALPTRAPRAIELPALDGVALGGLAVNPSDGHLFVLGTSTRVLYELAADGSVISQRDLAGAGIRDPGGMVVAPSGDPTDAADRMSMYLADSGTVVGEDVLGGGVHEFALSPVQLSPLMALASTASAVLVDQIDTSAWSPASPDPSGLTYLAGEGRLLAVDGEVEETTGAGWHDANAFITTLGGSLQRTFDTTVVTPSNDEPVGTGYDPVRDELYISKDGDNSFVWVYEPGGDGIFGTADDAMIRSFGVAADGVSDAEGLAFSGGSLFIADGLGTEIWRFAPGTNGIVDGGDDVVTHFDTGTLGQSDPEGIDVDPATGNLWIVSNDTTDPLLEVTTAGTPVQSVTMTGISQDSPAGLAVAPPSAGGTGTHVYVADRGEDNADDPNENDGRIYEFSLGGEPPPSHPFTDIDGNEFEDDITWIYNEGITTGCRATKYCPADPVTRVEMASFLVRAMGLPAPTGDHFTDDEAYGAAEDDINSLFEEGITNGCGGTNFCPGANVTRAEMASFLVRALDLPGSGDDHFTDDDGNFHEDNINSLADSGITGGCNPSGTQYCPLRDVRRDEMAAFLHRAFGP